MNTSAILHGASMTQTKRVSAVITSYNLEGLVARAIESVLPHCQTGPVGEIIVVDDGSTDGTRQIIEAMASQHAEIVPLFKENGGVASSKNAGVRIARYPLIAFLDGDDCWTADKFALQEPHFDRYPEAAIYVGDYIIETMGSRQISHVRAPNYFANNSDALRTLFLSGGIIPSAAVVQAKAFHVAGLFDETIRYVQDEEMWSRIAARYPVHRTPGVVLRKLEHPNNMSSNVLARVQSLDLMTAGYLKLDPSLQTDLALRDQRVAVMRAKALVALGRIREARDEFWRAWRLAPSRVKPMIFFAASLFGRPDLIIDALKVLSGRTRHMSGKA